MSDTKTTSFLDRALRNLRGAWGKIAGPQKDHDLWAISADLSEGDDEIRLKDQMQACLDDYGGEVSARARAAALGHAYLALNEVGRLKFLKLMTENFGSDPVAVEQAMEDVLHAKDFSSRQKSETKLRHVLEPPRTRLLTQFNALPDGVKFLVDMRSELVGHLKANPELWGLEDDLKSLLNSWFDIGFLELRQITWNAPAALLEKLMAYEPVHEIASWHDMKNRLAADRRCFAFFHPRMPDEPLIFVWVALVEGIAANVGELLDETAPEQDAETADTAIFYSISNAQPGLRGISFGDFLIKRVVDSLRGELANLKNFATLSPIPGFRRWLSAQISSGELALTDDESKALLVGGEGDAVAVLESRLNSPGWHEDKENSVLKAPLTRLCAEYLLNQRRKSGTALDSVAHFHLTNGSRVEQINWLADTSVKGLEQSAGMMVNYLYELENIEANHETYRGAGTVSASSAVRNLIKS